jgi:hypothetical protein
VNTTCGREVGHRVFCDMKRLAIAAAVLEKMREEGRKARDYG